MSERGQITEEIKALAARELGLSDFSQRALRLLPYIQYVMMNNQRIDPAKVNDEEREILSFWREKGFIDGGASGLTVTKQFWDFISEACWLGYVIYEETTNTVPAESPPLTTTGG